jgi:predicted PhzF superfamily epimerase YddE/YHI9
MKISQYQVDAFAARVFEGKPSASCPLESWPDNREPLAGGAIAFVEADNAF